MDDALENLEEYLKLMKEYKDLGISPDDILRGTRKALEEKKKTDIIAQQIAQGKENSVTKNQTMVFDYTTDCKIFQDGRNTKIKTWSVRIWDRKRKKPIIRSLKTVDKATALTLARDMYMTFTTRGAVYLSTDSITTKELVALYIQKRRGEVSPNPQEGITARSLNVIESRLKHWMDYIDEKGYSKANIENIPPELGLDFAIWIKNRKITTGKRLGERKNRSNTTINQIVGAAKRMYHKVGIDGGYITANELPKFTTLKKSRNQCSNRDVLQHSEMSLLYKWMREKYAVESAEITTQEYIKRRIFNLTFTIHNLTGVRPAELLGTRWSEIRPVRETIKGGQDNMVITIDATRSKTGKTRYAVAPIGKQLDRIKFWYERLGHHVEPHSDEFVFLKLTKSGIENNIQQTQKAMGDRLKAVLKGATEDKNCPLNLKNMNITLYSARHYYVTQQIMEGTDHHTIGRQVGTGTQYIDDHYSHLIPEMKQEQICNAAKNQDHLIVKFRK
mgnify:FL=1